MRWSMQVLIAAVLSVAAAANLGAQTTGETDGGPIVQPEAGEYLLSARTIIQGQLITGIHSDLPGVIVAQITRDVWDQQQQVVVIPRGSFLTGSYGNSVVLGQDRLALAWTQLELPNGQRYPLPGLWGMDRAGKAGVEGDVNNHMGRVIKAALLTSVVSYLGASQMSDRQIGYEGQPSPRDQAISGGIEQVQRVSDRVTQRDLQIEPTIEIPQGKRFAIIVGQDLILPAYPMQ